MLQKERTTAATANLCSVMESGNHSKNGASLKSLMSKGNLLTMLSLLFLTVVMGACKGSGGDDDDEPEVLAVPTGVAVSQEKDGFRVSWDPVEGAENYMVEYFYDYSIYEYYKTEEGIWNADSCYILFPLDISGRDRVVSSCSFKVRAARNYYNEVSDWSESVYCVYVHPGGGLETGLYMGVIGFNEELNEKSISLLTDYKNTYHTNDFMSFINGMLMKPATGLYYAVDNALNRLEMAKLPEDLVNVSIVTFTDGLDNVSIDLNNEYNSRDAYRDALKKRITDTKINQLSINAYSIGVMGGDVKDEDAFLAGLKAMASHPDNAKKVNNMNEVNKTFSEIAASLYNENKSQTIKLKITGGYDDGTKIRFTLDDVVDAKESEFYIEGTYKRNGSTRTLQDVVYHGVKSSSGKTISGEVSGVYVTFSFEGFEVINPLVSISLQNIRQWEYVSSNAQWQKNSEFGKDGDIVPIVDKKSAVILLVLDCTTSLEVDGFRDMKNAATNFVKVVTGKN